MRLALDSNRYTDLCRGDSDVVAALERAEEIQVPFVVLGELRAGFAAGKRRAHNEAVLRAFLLKPGVRVLLASEDTTLHYAAVYRQLRAQGTPIPTNDMWIAALVLQHGLVLFHRDRHFEQLPQLATL
ncbi:MAG TPA: type II toxin-antitoxin system VapC family toxin [Thermoanaerobaculia bacterium]|jgi:tRNA(fMet)-specific endonuclease VapC|nr:type II toxin-antitoxin system VapC family toxin [Thermoanaerobaculia bacterium]